MTMAEQLQQTTVRVEDQTSPAFSFTTGSKTIDWLVGTPFQVPTGFVTANDNLGGNITGSIIFGNLDLIDENKEEIRPYLTVSDAAGNMCGFINRVFQTPTFSLNGVAIDGYLTDCIGCFRPTNPSISNNLFYEQRIQREVLSSIFSLMNSTSWIQTEWVNRSREGMIEVSVESTP